MPEHSGTGSADSGSDAPARLDVVSPFHRVLANREVIAGGSVVLLLVLVALLGPVFVSAAPNKQHLSEAFTGPFSSGHVLGTDQFGRDVLDRLIASARVDLVACAVAVGIAVVGGVPLGLLAGYFGGWLDVLLMRATDAIQSFPPLILALGLVGVLGQGLVNAMIAIGVVFMPNLIRITRAAVQEAREYDYVAASQTIGTPTLAILSRRIWPNVLPNVMVHVTSSAGFALLAEAGLSFLGLGEQLPNASWGSMLNDGYQNLVRQPSLAIFPGVAIAITVLAFNLLGDGLSAALGTARSRR